MKNIITSSNQKKNYKLTFPYICFVILPATTQLQTLPFFGILFVV
jgi:hypothetical protein